MATVFLRSREIASRSASWTGSTVAKAANGADNMRPEPLTTCALSLSKGALSSALRQAQRIKGMHYSGRFDMLSAHYRMRWSQSYLSSARPYWMSSSLCLIARVISPLSPEPTW
jgi:hypothetical protein